MVTFALDRERSTLVVPGGSSDVPASPTPSAPRSSFAVERGVSLDSNIVNTAIPRNPDTEARQQQLSKDSGLPLDAIKEDESTVVNNARAVAIDKAVEKAPATTEYMNNQDNADVSHDDVEELGSLERTWNSFNIGRLQHDLGAAGTELRDSPSEESRKRVSAIQEELASMGETPGDDITSWFEEAGKILGQISSSLVSTDMVANAGVGALTGLFVGGPVGALTGAAVGAGVTMGFDSFESEGGLAYIEMRKIGIDRDIAKVASIGVGVINAGLELVGMTGAMKPLTTTAKLMLRSKIQEVALKDSFLSVAGGVLKQHGIGVTGEVLTEVLEEAVQVGGEEWAKLMDGQDFKSISSDEFTARLEEVMIATFKGTIVLGGLAAGPQVVVRKRAIRKAIKTEEALNTLVKDIQTTKTAERSPEQTMIHVGKVLAEDGVKSILIPAKKLAIWIDQQPDPEKVLESTGVAADLEEAIIRGSDIEIDVVNARQLFLSDDFVSVSEHIRLDDNDQTAFEARESIEANLEESGLPASGHPAINSAQQGGQQNVEERDAQIRQLYGDEAADIYISEINRIAAAADVDPKKSKKKKASEKKKPVPPKVLAALEAAGLKGMYASAKEAGMSQKEYTEYVVKIQRAIDDVIANDEAKTIKRTEKLLAKNLAKKRAAIQEEMTQKVTDENPVYQVLEALGETRMDRKPILEALKRLGKKVGDLPRLSRNRSVVSKTKEAGLAPELIADLYNFESVDAMVKALTEATPLALLVEAHTVAAMEQRHGDKLSAAGALVELRESLYSESQGDVLHTELNAMKVAEGEKRLSARVMAVAAKDILLRMTMKNIDSKRFMATSARLGREAAKALNAGDRPTAIQIKTQQVMSFHMAKEAIRLKTLLDRQQRELVKHQDRKNANVGVLHQDAIIELLDRINFRPRLTKKARGKLEEAAAQKRNPFKINQKLLNDDRPVHWKDMTLGEFQAVLAKVKEIAHVGRTELKLRRLNEKNGVTEEVATLLPLLEEHLTDRTSNSQLVDRSRWQAAKDTSVAFAARLFNIGTLVRELDGFKDLGANYKAIKGRYDDALARGYNPGQVGLLSRRDTVAKDIIKLYSTFTLTERKAFNDTFTIPGMTRKVSHQDVLSVLLNSGNLQNMRAMLESGTVTEQEFKAIHKYASKRDFEFAQSVWDYMDTYWNEVVSSEQKRKNITPQRVAPQSFSNEHGSFKGGYYPLRYDDKKTAFMQAKDAVAAVEDMRLGAHVSSHTDDGHRQARKDGLGNKVLLDVFVINSHLDKVVYDLEMGDALSDIFKIVHNPDYRKVFAQKGMTHKWEMIDLWLRDVITDQIGPQNPLEVLAKHLRTGLTVSKLGLNIGVAALQPLGILQTAAQIGTVNTLSGLQAVVSSPWWGPNSIADLSSAESAVMKGRITAYDKDIADSKTQVKTHLLDRITPGNSADFIRESWFWMIKKMQRFADLVTYMGAKRDGMTKFGNEKQAIIHAENMVNRTQSSGIFGERSALERGSFSRHAGQSEVYRAFTVFLSYFMAKTNIAIEQFKITEFNKPISVLKFMNNMALLYLWETIAVATLKQQWPDEDEGDEESKVGFLMKETANQALGAIPIVGMAVQSVKGFATGGPLSSTAEEFGRLVQALSDDDPLDKRSLNSAVSFGAIMVKAPGAVQFTRTASAIERAKEGYEVSLFEYIMGINKRR